MQIIKYNCVSACILFLIFKRIFVKTLNFFFLSWDTVLFYCEVLGRDERARQSRLIDDEIVLNKKQLRAFCDSRQRSVSGCCSFTSL